MEKHAKDFWDKLEIVLNPVGGLFTAASVVVLGFVASSSLNEKQDKESRTRVYAELMSQREQAESLLRKDMFVSIIDTFLNAKAGSTEATPGPEAMETKILNMELLAYNFHESLNLKPLFLHLQREIRDSTNFPGEAKKSYAERLEKVACDVAQRQTLALKGAGKSIYRTVRLDLLEQNLTQGKGPLELAPEPLQLDEFERTFQVFVLQADSKTHYLKVRLVVSTAKPVQEANSMEFWVGYYDLPMIDNTRLSNDQRCAIVLDTFDADQASAEIALIYFPGSHSSLKERPYYEDVIRNLEKRQTKALAEK